MAPQVKQVLIEPTLVKHLQGHNSSVNCVSFDPATKQLASGSKDKSLMVWTLKDNLRAYRYLGHNGEITDVCFSPAGQLVATSSYDGSVRLWVPNAMGKQSGFPAHSRTVRSVCFSENESKIITASDDKLVKEYDIRRKNVVTTFKGHTNWVKCARLSNDFKIVGSVSDDKTSKLFDRTQGKCIHTFVEMTGSPTKIAFHPWERNCFAVSFSNNIVKVFDMRMMKQRQLYDCHEDVVTSVEFHSSGNYLFSTSYDGTVKVLDLLEGRPIYTIKGHDRHFFDVAASDDGEYFATASVDNQVMVWKSNFMNVEVSNDSNNKPESLYSEEIPLTDSPKDSLTTVNSKFEISPEREELSENNSIKESSQCECENVNLDKVDQLLSKIESLSCLMKKMDERLSAVEEKYDKFSKFIIESGF